MAKNPKKRAGLHKEISSIFKRVVIPQEEDGNDSSIVYTPDDNDHASDTQLATKSQEDEVSTSYQVEQDLPETEMVQPPDIGLVEETEPELVEQTSVESIEEAEAEPIEEPDEQPIAESVEENKTGREEQPFVVSIEETEPEEQPAVESVEVSEPEPVEQPGVVSVEELEVEPVEEPKAETVKETESEPVQTPKFLKASETNVLLSTNVLLFTLDDNTARTVQATLLDNHGMALAGICKDISEIKPHLSNNNIQVVVVDIDHDPSHLLYELNELSHSFPDIYIVVISESFHRDFVLRAMQAGARHFLEKKNVTKELSDVLLHLNKTSKRKKRLSGSSGSVISVFSAGGGCGATTVTVNLASELRLLSSQKILVIDLDNCYGTISTYMGIKSRYGIADVMNRTGLIDKYLIQSSAFNYMEDFHVLVSPVGLDSPKAISLEYKNLPHVLESCRELYEYTVIDASQMSGQEMINLAGLSDILLIVFQLTIKDVNVTRRIVESLSQAGIDSQKIMLLVNRFKKRGPFVRLEDSKKVIGLDSFQIIRSDWKTAMKSINHGQPLNQVARSSGLRNDFRKLATKIQARHFNGGSKSQGD